MLIVPIRNSNLFDGSDRLLSAQEAPNRTSENQLEALEEL